MNIFSFINSIFFSYLFLFPYILNKKLTIFYFFNKILFNFLLKNVFYKINDFNLMEFR